MTIRERIAGFLPVSRKKYKQDMNALVNMLTSANHLITLNAQAIRTLVMQQSTNINKEETTNTKTETKTPEFNSSPGNMFS